MKIDRMLLVQIRYTKFDRDISNLVNTCEWMSIYSLVGDYLLNILNIFLFFRINKI